MDIPNKFYFKIGEVSKITDIKPYVLRYWEKEFQAIKPVKDSSKQRLYRKEDIYLILQIKKLLYEDKFTIAGAREKLRQKKGENAKSSHKGDYKILMDIKKELIGLKNFIFSFN